MCVCVCVRDLRMVCESFACVFQYLFMNLLCACVFSACCGCAFACFAYGLCMACVSFLHGFQHFVCECVVCFLH